MDEEYTPSDISEVVKQLMDEEGYEFGEAVKAVIELKPEHPRYADPTLVDELIRNCRERLSHVKCPKSIDITAALPRHPTGKLYKSKLRDPYWADRSSSII